MSKIEKMSSLPYSKTVRLTKEDTDTLWKEFLSYRPKLLFNMSCWSIAARLCCRSFRCCQRQEKVWENSFMFKQTLLEASQYKVEKELDVVTIMKTTRYLRLLINSILTRKAKALLLNQ